MQVGLPIGYFMDKTDGVFQNQAEINAHPSVALGANAVSDIRFVDVNNDGVNLSDRTNIEIQYQRQQWDSICK
jgi:hypothetical protein